MKRLIIRFTLGAVGCAVAAFVCSFLSGFLTVFTDPSQEATVGVISLRGFPIWFYQAADGISIMRGWQLDRFGLNCMVWFLAWFSLFTYGAVRGVRQDRTGA